MADWNWDKFGDDDDDEENEEGGAPRWQFGSRDGLIFLIDCSEAMFKLGDDDEESAFDLCIKCTKSVIQNKIISSDKDLMGVVLFATEKDKNSSDFKNIYILHDLDVPGAEKVLQLEELLEEGNGDFKNKIGHSKTFSLSDALWTCSNMFSNSPQKLGFKRVLLFTNNDNPHDKNPQLKRQAAAKAEDLHQNGIDLELMNINPPNDKFDITAFYKDILFEDEDGTTAQADPAEKFDELLNKVRAKDHKKRAQARLPLTLGDGLTLQVGMYNLVRACHKPYAVKLYKKTNEEVKAVTKTFLQETAEILMPHDLKKSQTYGGQQLCFEQEEVKEMKTFEGSGLTLLGFKPRSAIKPYFHVKPANFLYPDEDTVSGSKCLFTALLRRLVARDSVAICRCVARRGSPPRFVALVPQDEELDEHGVQVAPPGFHLIPLPFADDFRNVTLEKGLPQANQTQVDKAKEIVKKLMFSFSSESFENPVLQNHYSAVEAMALDRDEKEEVTDYTLPDNNRVNKRAGTLIEEFKELVFPEGYVPGAKPRAAAKKPKLEPDGDLDIEKEARAGKLSKLTVAVLKDAVKKLKINPLGTKKADLIDTINAHFDL